MNLLRIRRVHTYADNKFRVTCRSCAGWGHATLTFEDAIRQADLHYADHVIEYQVRNHVEVTETLDNHSKAVLLLRHAG